MIETFAALLLAHAVTDFVLQSGWMAANKTKAGALFGHGLIVLGTALLTTGTLSPLLVGLALAHMAIDLGKALSGRRGIGAFLADQGAHLACLLALAHWQPGLWASGFWATQPALPAMMAVAAGLILTVRAGGFAVGLLMQPWAKDAPEGLANGGRMIGTLERGLIFVLVMAGQAEGIGLLIAAKSVLRFGAVKDDLKVSEYVIIGTLASFGWALVTAFLTVFLLNHLPSLGIPDLTP